MDRKTLIYALIIVAVAGLLRFGFCAFGEGFHAPNRGVEAEYHALGKNVAAGSGFVDSQGRPTARQSPAYPFLLGTTYKIFGPHKIIGRILQILLGMAVIFFVFVTCARYFDRTTAGIAAALTALNPFLIVSSAHLLAENLYMVFVLAGLYLVPRPGDLTKGRRNDMLAAVFLAGAALTIHAAVPLAVWILAAGFLFGAARNRRRLFNVMLMAVLFSLILLPWGIRNHNRLGGWVGITTGNGMEFYQGNNPVVLDFKYYRGGAVPPGSLPMYHRLAAVSELERDRMAWRMGSEFLRHNLRHVPKLAWWKFTRFWRFETGADLKDDKKTWWLDQESILRSMTRGFDEGLAYAVVVLPLFVVGIVLTRRRWRELIFLYGIIVVHTLTATVFYGSIRGRIPVEPVIAMFTAFVLTRVWSWARSRRFGPGQEQT